MSNLSFFFLCAYSKSCLVDQTSSSTKTYKIITLHLMHLFLLFRIVLSLLHSSSNDNLVNQEKAYCKHLYTCIIVWYTGMISMWCHPSSHRNPNSTWTCNDMLDMNWEYNIIMVISHLQCGWKKRTINFD